MQRSRRAVCSSVLLGPLVAVSGTLLRLDAATYPAKPITLVMPFPPGGEADTFARPLANVAQQHLGQPMVVVNKAGGAGAVGTQYVANAKPDGYTLLYSLNALTELPQIDELLGRPPAFKAEQFLPIGQVAVSPCAIIVNEVVATLRRGLQAMVEDETFKASLQKLGETAQYMNAEAFGQFLEQDYQRLGGILRQIIKKD
jgi:tripartite-type tricarboxylate transporter receptor subunit TctC